MCEKERKRFIVVNCDIILDVFVVWYLMCVWCNCYFFKFDFN